MKAVTGRGGETFKVGVFTIDPILGRHGDPPEDVTAAFNKALQVGTTPITAEQSKEQAAIRARGTSDPKVTAEGTIAYLITLDNGFRIAYRDSGGVVTDIERAAFAKIPGVDLALAATSAAFLNSLTSQQALEYVRTLQSDGVHSPRTTTRRFNGLWRATEPIFQAISRKILNIQTFSKGYREPTCFVTDCEAADIHSRRAPPRRVHLR